MNTYDRKKARREEREREWERALEARRVREKDQFIGTNRADGLAFLTCVLCGAMVDPDYADQHLDRCKEGK